MKGRSILKFSHFSPEVVNYEFGALQGRDYKVLRLRLQGSVRMVLSKVADKNYIEKRRKKILKADFLKKLGREARIK